MTQPDGSVCSPGHDGPMSDDEIHFLPRRGKQGPPQTVGYRIDPATGCWNWTGTHKHAYGNESRGTAHRTTYERLVGPIPAGHDLHHLCENTRCVNPAHLEPQPAERHRGRPAALSPAKVAEVREVLAAGFPQWAIAEVYGVSHHVISHIKRGRGRYAL